jgi:hypothetical protein
VLQQALMQDRGGGGVWGLRQPHAPGVSDK